MQPRAIGIPWFHREDYERAKTIMADGATFIPAFEQWEKRAKAVLADMQQSGHIAEPVHLDLDAFLAFCRAHNIKPDGHGCSRYAALEMARRYPDRS